MDGWIKFICMGAHTTKDKNHNKRTKVLRKRTEILTNVACRQGTEKYTNIVLLININLWE